MYRYLFFLLFSFNFVHASETLVRYKEAPTKLSDQESDYVNTYIPTYVYEGPDISLDGLQCPIPREDRVKNYTGIQCVYSSIEALGRWAEEPKLINPPLTSRPDCKSYSGPQKAGAILNRLGVKFEQTYGNREKGIKMIKKAMREGRGCLWDVPGHAMILVHYDESQNRVCWVDNSDSSLKVQQTTIERFNKRWGSWVLVVYADKDVIPEKVYKYNFPILDHATERKESLKGFIPFPQIAF